MEHGRSASARSPGGEPAPRLDTSGTRDQNDPMRRALLVAGLLALPLAVPLPGCGDPGPHVAGDVVDLDGRAVDPMRAGAVASVLLFVSVDCPISNRYAPEIARLGREFSAHGVALWLVYPNRDDGADEIRGHLAEYGLRLPALRDPRHALVRAADARWTPEAAVVVPDAGVIYRGRIDDRYVAFGTSRPEPTRHDLRDVLRAVVGGRVPPPRTTEVVGCHIQPLD